MAQLKSRLEQQDQVVRVIVDAPHIGDALGNSLRGAFGRDRSLPHDMLTLLNDLDRKTDQLI